MILVVNLILFKMCRHPCYSDDCLCILECATSTFFWVATSGGLVYFP